MMKFFGNRICFMILCLLLAQKLPAQQNVVKKEKVSGDFYFLLGPSGIPVGLRGSGRNEHWETGVHLNVEYKKLEFNFTPVIIGAATFDNPDRFQFVAGTSYRFWRNLSIQAVLSDAYALNNIPPADPESRWPTSGINTFWLGGRWDVKKNQNKISIFTRYGLRGNEPILFTHFTKPYARWHLGVSARNKLTKKTFFIFGPEIYASNDLDIARAVLNLGVERRLHDKLIVGGYYTANRNLGIPESIVDYRGYPLRKTANRLFFGFRMTFGDSH